MVLLVVAAAATAEMEETIQRETVAVAAEEE